MESFIRCADGSCREKRNRHQSKIDRVDDGQNGEIVSFSKQGSRGHHVCEYQGTLDQNQYEKGDSESQKLELSQDSGTA